MKRHLIYGSLAALGLISLASCSSEEDMPVISGDGVTFTLRVPGNLATRGTFGDGTDEGDRATLDNLQWTVFEVSEDGTTLTKVFSDAKANAFAGSQTEETVTIKLAKGKKYQVAFYADDKDNQFVTYTDGDIDVDYSKAAGNTAAEDAFIGKSDIFTVEGAFVRNVTLTRPFAQLNWGTDDTEEKSIEPLISSLTGTVKVTQGLYTRMNVISGEVDANSAVTDAVTFAAVNFSALPGKTFPVSKEDKDAEPYKLVAMNYLLTGNGTVDCELAFNNGLSPVTVSAATVKVNYRTNIYGSLLTSPGKFNITVDASFDDDNNITPEDFNQETISKGGHVMVNAPVEAITIPAEINEPLYLSVNAKVGKITLPATNNNAITINVAKDVDYPSIEFTHNSTITDLTIKGDPASSKLAEGFIFIKNGSGVNPRPAKLTNFTLDGINFNGAGFVPQYSVSTEGVVIRNCKFVDCYGPAVGVQHSNGGSGQTAKDYLIENCAVKFASEVKAGQNGLYLLDITGDVIVRNNTIEGASAHGVYVCGNTHNPTGVRPLASKVEITGNTVTGKTRDGIKIENETAALLKVTDNKVAVVENGIRIKNSLDGNALTITSNTVDMQNANPFSETEQEPWGILIINTAAQPTSATITGTADDNTFLNSNGHDFVITNIN